MHQNDKVVLFYVFGIEKEISDSFATYYLNRCPGHTCFGTDLPMPAGTVTSGMPAAPPVNGPNIAAPRAKPARRSERSTPRLVRICVIPPLPP